LGECLGILDYYRFPDRKASWGGPFNGQQTRQQIFLDLLGAFKFAAIVETGTYRGTTTQFLVERSGLKVYTVESDPRNFGFAKARFCLNGRVRVSHDDSRNFLKKLSRTLAHQALFFYLDAHWYDDLPLREEVAFIFDQWADAVIMIDDFKVPDDAGYGYDNYGEGKELSLEYLASLPDWPLAAFFPRKGAAEETGAKRGSVVLAVAEDVKATLRTIGSLRSFEIHKSSKGRT